jgi:hypothetical protein
MSGLDRKDICREPLLKSMPGPLAIATLKHRIHVLSKALSTRDLKSPCEEHQVKDLLAMTRRAYAQRGARPRNRATRRSTRQATGNGVAVDQRDG